MPASRPKKPGDPQHPRAYGPLRSFGRLKSRVIKPLQAALFDSLLPRLAIPDPAGGAIDPRSLMPSASQVWLEIGFGGGEHLAAQAARHPDTLMIGCEPFLNGVASLLRHIDEGGVENIRIHADDARAVVEALPEASLDRVLILFPDPWHKVRHNKRRLISDAFALSLSRVLKPGGQLRFVTDWKDYADWALERFLRTPGLTWTADQADDWRTAPPDHVVTRYEEKKLGDSPPLFLEFRREPSQ